MSKIIIEGGNRLEGSVKIHGAKNAVLPILAATLLNEGVSVIQNCPRLKDVYSSLEILRNLGCSVEWQDDTLLVDSRNLSNYYIPEVLMREMRSSIIFLGAIVSRCRKAFITYPGGCELGPRPIDLHLKAFRQLGIKIDESHGFISCTVDQIKPSDIHLDFPSVGATENIMLVSAISNGTTTIINAAKEPEIVDLQKFLNGMGAKISGAGTSVISIEGSKKLHDVRHTVMPDRIVAASYLAAGIITGSDIQVLDVNIDDLNPVLSAFRDCGQKITSGTNFVNLQSKPIRPIKFIRTMPHPGFPTDAQAQLTAVLSVAGGTSVIAENIFENRFRHVEELARMGADIKVENRIAVIRGVKELSGAKVVAPDLRGGAALVIAGLRAGGVTEVSGIHHIDRGYEAFDAGLAGLGAKIQRIETEEENNGVSIQRV